MRNRLKSRAPWELAEAALGLFHTSASYISSPFSLSWVRIPRVDLLTGMLCAELHLRICSL